VDMDAVPAPLRTRLGSDATVGLLELLDVSQREAREALIAVCIDRFERRLVEEVSGLRVEIARVESRIRQDMVQLGAGLRQEIGDMAAGLRGEIATGRVELFKWCFLFWIGQVLAIGGLMSVMLRLMR
jgi:hypothetical protein